MAQAWISPHVFDGPGLDFDKVFDVPGLDLFMVFDGPSHPGPRLFKETDRMV